MVWCLGVKVDAANEPRSASHNRQSPMRVDDAPAESCRVGEVGDCGGACHGGILAVSIIHEGLIEYYLKPHHGLHLLS